MSANSLSVPFPIFNDIDGDPLDAGYIYIGTANLDPETNPINVYFDEALSVPAAQPIRTINGFPSNSGSPARLYVNADDYSITIKNKNGSQVYTSSVSTLSLSSGTINYTEGSTGSVQRTLTSKLQEVVSLKDFGAVGDGVTDDTNAIKACVAAVVANGGGSIFVPFGTYKTTETIYLKGINGLIGESTSKAGGTQFDIGGSSFKAYHTGAAVLSLKGAGGVRLENITIEADLANSPKVGLCLGRDSTSSAGNHLIENVTIRGAYTVACIYSIASEEVTYIKTSAWLYADNSGLFTFYCAESDVYSVDTLTTSTNISGYFYGCSFVNSSFDVNAAVVKIDAGGQTGSWCLTSTYLVPNAGSYIYINNQTSASEILGPFVFNGVNGERLGVSGDPTYGLRIESSVGCTLRGLTWVGSRINFQAGATKKTVSIPQTMTLFQPCVVINPEEAFAYAVVDYNRNNIQGGIFSVGREAFWTVATLSGSWINRFGSPYPSCAYKLDGQGQVTLRGELAGGTGAILTLPEHYRPKENYRIKTVSDAGVALLLIDATTGVVSQQSGTATGLDMNISFQTN